MKVGIIGGKGQMGGVFKALLTAQGAECLVSDTDSELSNGDLVKNCDVILVSVPISAVVDVINGIAPSLRENQLVADLSSIKEAPVKAMLASKAEVIGLHPMFGPGLKTFKGQTVIYCPARKGELGKKFLELLAASGLILKEATPEKHDSLMAVIQGLNHVSSIILAKTLSECAPGLLNTIDYASPAYKIRAQLLSRLMGEPAELYADIVMNNANNFPVLEVLQKNSEEMNGILRNRDRKAFLDYFNKAAGYFSEGKESGKEFSDKLIEYIGTL